MKQHLFPAFLCICLLMLFVCTAVSAETVVSVGDSALTLSLPDDFICSVPTAEALQNGVTGQWYNRDLVLVLYQWEDDQVSLETIVRGDAASYNAVEQGMTEVNGIQAGWYRCSDGGYPLECWLFRADGRLLEADFAFFDIPDYSVSTAIMATLAENGTAVHRGELRLAWTDYVISLPDGFTRLDISDEDVADGVVDGWFSNDLFLLVRCCGADGCSAGQLARESAERCGSISYGVNYIGQLPVGYYVNDERPDGGEMLSIGYYLIAGRTAVELRFIMREDAASVQAAAMMESIHQGEKGES